MKKKIVLLMVCIVCTFMIFSACDNNTGGSSGNQDEGLKGEEFYFRGSFIAEDPRDDPDADPSSAGNPYIDTAEGEAMFDHCMKIEEELNCKIIRISDTYTSTSEFAASYATGQTPTDILCAPFADLLDLYKSEMLVDLYTLKTLDATDEEKWGSEQRKEATTYQGALYAFPVQGSMYFPFTDNYNGAFIYNVDLYNSYGVEMSPAELIETGLWTFSGFQDLLSDVMAPELDRPKYGISLVNSLPTIAVYANGGDVIIKNNKGEYVFGYTTDNAVHALEWARTITLMDGAIAPNSFQEDFEKGNATFALVPASNAISSAISTVGWLPFPYGPDVEYGTTYTSYFGYHETGISILKHTDDPERESVVGTVVNALFEPTDKYGKTGYDEYMARNFFNTQEDYEIYKEHGLNMHYDWSKEMIGSSVVTTFQEAVANAIASSGGSIRQQMEAIEENINENVCKDLNGK